MGNEQYQVTAGRDWTQDVQLADAAGVDVTTYTGSEALATAVWPGGDRATSFAAATTWLDPALGHIRVAITAAETAGLAPGRYRVETTLTEAGRGPVDAWSCTLEVQAGPGTAVAPKTYIDPQLLYRYGRSWLRQLETDDDQAGFVEQVGRATSWIDDVCHAKYRVASMAMVVGGQALGPRISGARSTWLQSQLDAVPSPLMTTDALQEAIAKKALAYICEGQVGIGDSAQQYAGLARMYRSQAEALISGMTISLDTNGDGFPDITIDCSTCNALYG